MVEHGLPGGESCTVSSARGSPRAEYKRWHQEWNAEGGSAVSHVWTRQEDIVARPPTLRRKGRLGRWYSCMQYTRFWHFRTFPKHALRQGLALKTDSTIFQ